MASQTCILNTVNYTGSNVCTAISYTTKVAKLFSVCSGTGTAASSKVTVCTATSMTTMNYSTSKDCTTGGVAAVAAAITTCAGN